MMKNNDEDGDVMQAAAGEFRGRICPFAKYHRFSLSHHPIFYSMKI